MLPKRHAFLYSYIKKKSFEVLPLPAPAGRFIFWSFVSVVSSMSYFLAQQGYWQGNLARQKPPEKHGTWPR